MNARKTQFKRGALGKIKNHKAAWFTGTLAAAGIAVFVFMKSCGPIAEGPLPINPVRGDRICEQSEAYPNMLNSDGTEMRDSSNQPIPNPHYSKEDCHRGDGVCDNNSEEVRNRDGTPITNLMSAFIDGTAIPSPLEDENSPDCVMQRVRDNQCAEIAEDRSNVISRGVRPRVTEETELGLRQRSRAELEAMHADITAVELGNNYFVVANNYSESCDMNLPLCTPDSTEACSCPNHQDCIPDHCGNGVVERNEGEQCDPGSQRGRRACSGNTACSGSCQCVERRRPTKIDRPPPEPTCGNGRIDTGEDCDPPGSTASCGANERCNSSCECEEQAPTAGGPCEGNRVPGAGPLIARVSSQVTSASTTIKNALGAPGVPVMVSVAIDISASGVPTIRGASASCGGSSCPSSANIVSLSGLNVSGITTGSPPRACYIAVPVRLR